MWTTRKWSCPDHEAAVGSEPRGASSPPPPRPTKMRRPRPGPRRKQLRRRIRIDDGRRRKFQTFGLATFQGLASSERNYLRVCKTSLCCASTFVLLAYLVHAYLLCPFPASLFFLFLFAQTRKIARHTQNVSIKNILALSPWRG